VRFRRRSHSSFTFPHPFTASSPGLVDARVPDELSSFLPIRPPQSRRIQLGRDTISADYIFSVKVLQPKVSLPSLDLSGSFPFPIRCSLSVKILSCPHCYQLEDWRPDFAIRFVSSLSSAVVPSFFFSLDRSLPVAGPNPFFCWLWMFHANLYYSTIAAQPLYPQIFSFYRYYRRSFFFPVPLLDNRSSFGARSLFTQTDKRGFASVPFLRSKIRARPSPDTFSFPARSFSFPPLVCVSPPTSLPSSFCPRYNIWPAKIVGLFPEEAVCYEKGKLIFTRKRDFSLSHVLICGPSCCVGFPFLHSSVFPLLRLRRSCANESPPGL